MTRAAPMFATEAALCEAFVAWVREHGGKRYEPWTVYPETGGFDLLLVDPEGRQLGIEAKLRLNAKVCMQALPSRWYQGEGPDWRAVLVPEANEDFTELLRLFGVVVFTAYRDDQYRSGERVERFRFNPQLYASSGMYDTWFDWNPSKRCELPPMVPNLPAGVPCPIRLTTWKVGALKVLALLELRGHVTAREVRECGVDPRRFCAADGWLASAGEGKWTRGSIPAFDAQHPTEYAATLEQLRQAGAKA